MMKRQSLLIAAAAALLPLAAHAIEIYTPGGDDDPQVQLSRFLEADKRHFSAVVELQELAHGRDPLQMSPEFRLQLANNYLGFGMRGRAETMYRSLVGSSVDAEKLNNGFLRLAEFDFERGYYAESRGTLYRIRDKLPPKLLPDWQDLLARVLMAERRYGEAVDVLTKDNNASDQSPFTRYNLGIALIKDGRIPQGQTVLDKVGTRGPDSALELSLRDRANLSLGWQFLQTRQGGTAKPILSRVRVEGPFSNRALLGLGWAELAPEGDRIRKADAADDKTTDAKPALSAFSTLGVLIRPGFLEDDIFNRANLRSFRLKKNRANEETTLKRALVPWVELISRDPMDPAVQEAWLAIPYTLDRLGAHREALQYYEKAVDVMELARKRMDEAKRSIKIGRMVETIVRRDADAESGWNWKLRDLPDAPETYFLQDLLAQHSFQEGLKNYRDLRMLDRNLNSWKARLTVIEADYRSSDRPAADADELVSRAQRDVDPPYAGTSIGLQLDTNLAAPGTYARAGAAVPTLAPQLPESGVPLRFNGPLERSNALRMRLSNLQQQIKIATNAEARLLEAMANEELDGQRRQIERYLVEARFALARLYDRQQKGQLDND